MQLVQVSVDVPKEMNDVRLFIGQLISDIKAKKSTTEIIGGSLGSLMTAIEGWDQLDEEAKSKEAFNLYGLMAADIAKALKG